MAKCRHGIRLPRPRDSSTVGPRCSRAIGVVVNPIEALTEHLGDEDPPLATCLLLLSEALTGREDAVVVGNSLLDGLAEGVTDSSVTGVVRHLFDTSRFQGNIEDYHSPENSFLDRVLERRLGMPITLSAVVAEVGDRLGIGMHLVGMPGHVLVGLDDDPRRYVDAFGGTELDEVGVRRRFESIFGADTSLAPKALLPIDTIAVINRVCNNLTRSWLDRDRTALDRLLDVRTALPATPRDRQLLIGLAESRGRFDLAARLRTEVDPTDPVIDGLWARLN